MHLRFDILYYVHNILYILPFGGLEILYSDLEILEILFSSQKTLACGLEFLYYSQSIFTSVK